jgi:hypothetical protein
MRGRSIHDLTRDYLDAERRARDCNLDEATRQRLAAYQRFVERNGHRLGPFPQTLREVALAEPADSPVRADVLAEVEWRRWRPGRPWFRRLHVPATEPNPALRRTIVTRGAVNVVAYFERDGRPHGVAACGTGLRIYDLGTGQLVRELCGHSDIVTSVVLSRDGRHALSNSKDYTPRWWDLERGSCCLPRQMHSGRLTAVALSADGKHALFSSNDCPLRWWDLETGSCGWDHRLRALHMEDAVALSGDGKHALSLSYDDHDRKSVLRWWDLEKGTCSLILQGHTGEVIAVALSPDGKHALSGSYDDTLRYWDLESGTCRLTLEGHSGGVNAVALSADGKHALSGSNDHGLRWWELDRGTCRLALQGHSDMVSAVALSPDGKHALSASLDGTLRCWDLTTGRCRAVFPCEAAVWAAAFPRERGQFAPIPPPSCPRVSRNMIFNWKLWQRLLYRVGYGEISVAAIFKFLSWGNLRRHIGTPARGVSDPASRQRIVVAGLGDGQVQFFRLENP